MAALTAARDTPKRYGSLLDLPMKANVKGFQGALAVMDGGYAAPATTALNLIPVGIFTKTADNTGGAAGAVRAEIEPGIFKFENSSAGDAITEADIGKDVYAVDDQTVAKTSASNTRSVAGKVVGVASDGVWVKVGFLP